MLDQLQDTAEKRKEKGKDNLTKKCVPQAHVKLSTMLRLTRCYWVVW
jgi:hypothetical protein